MKDTPDRDGITPLMLAAANGHTPVVKLLLQRWVDKRAQDASGFTAAHHAAKNARQECMDVLLDAGAPLTAEDCMGQLLIHLAAVNGGVEMVQSLLERGCAVNGGEIPSDVTCTTGLALIGSRTSNYESCYQYRRRA